MAALTVEQLARIAAEKKHEARQAALAYRAAVKEAETKANTDLGVWVRTNLPATDDARSAMTFLADLRHQIDPTQVPPVPEQSPQTSQVTVEHSDEAPPVTDAPHHDSPEQETTS